jgi:soluble lytic murein transglycosylase-like protein
MKVENDLIREAYGVVKLRIGEMDAKIRILEVLRAKTLTIRQGLDIADTVLSQRDIPVSMVLAIMDVESSFDSNAISPKGARGLLQAMPLTSRIYAGEFSKNIHDPVINIRTCVRYLVDLKRIYGEDWAKILRTYNGGPPNVNNKALDGYVRMVLARAKAYEVKVGQN